MPRAPFDTTCDLIGGPSSASPGIVYATGPCRFVSESVEIPNLLPLSLRLAYITLDFAQPNQAHVVQVGNVFTVDYGFADLIAVPTGHAVNYRVLFNEYLAYRGHSPYYRAHVQAASGGPPVPGFIIFAAFFCQVTSTPVSVTAPFTLGPSAILSPIASAGTAFQLGGSASIVQSGFVQNLSIAPTYTILYPSSVTSGNTLVLSVNAFGPAATYTVSDSQGNVWTRVTNVTDQSFWVTKASGTGVLTVTVTISSGSFLLPYLMVYECHNVGTAISGVTQQTGVSANPSPGVSSAVFTIASPGFWGASGFTLR